MITLNYKNKLDTIAQNTGDKAYGQGDLDIDYPFRFRYSDGSGPIDPLVYFLDGRLSETDLSRSLFGFSRGLSRLFTNILLEVKGCIS